ncbi:hypothetical protein H311_04096 [Anncaliia algerae PRA109]|nr:hypothetical protein H311_04096 [Anncaliia algerae PRA109]
MRLALETVRYFYVVMKCELNEKLAVPATLLKYMKANANTRWVGSLWVPELLEGLKSIKRNVFLSNSSIIGLMLLRGLF